MGPNWWTLNPARWRISCSGRSAEAFAVWLKEYPGVEVVGDDHSGEYADTVKRLAPDAVQVADRYHPLKNLRDVVL